MIMGYYRLGKYEDARRSMKKMLDYARRFRMDNPLVDFGNAPYQPGLPINCVYDNWGVPAAMVRGLFEYLYRADGLTIVPHIPAKITRLEQHFPIRFGTRRIYLATTGQGPITGVIVNGQPWKTFTTQQVLLPYDQVPGETVVQIVMGDAKPQTFRPKKQDLSALPGGTRHGFASAEPGRGGRRRDEQSAAANRRTATAGAVFWGRSHAPGCSAGRCRHRRSPHLAAGKTIDDVSLVGDWTPGSRRDNIVPHARGERLPAKIVGELPLTDSTHGKAAHFTGKGYLEIAHDPRLNLTKALTLDAWIRPAVLPGGGGRIIDKSEVGTSNGFLLDTHPGNSLRLIVDAGVASYDAKFQPDKWVHVAATVAPDGKIAMYVDGKPVAVQTGPSNQELDLGQLSTQSLPWRVSQAAGRSGPG